ncbi:MAG: glutaredoxin family protein [Spirochaetales bacterium]|nr:glutaredoxin family protein [Spirochaetales bacterium]
MNFVRVEGKNKGKVKLYAISTCIWCRKTKNLLDELNVEYEYIYVDLEPAEEKHAIEKEVLKWKSRAAYPLIVIDDKKCITSFDEDEIRKAFA